MLKSITSWVSSIYSTIQAVTNNDTSSSERYSHLYSNYAKEVYKKASSKEAPDKEKHSAQKFKLDVVNHLANDPAPLQDKIQKLIETFSLYKYDAKYDIDDTELFDSNYFNLSLKRKAVAHYTTQKNHIDNKNPKIENYIQHINKNSLVLRKLSLAAGVIFGLELSNSSYPVNELMLEQKYQIEEGIKSLLIKSIESVGNSKKLKLKNEVNKFIAEMAKIISKATNLSINSAKEKIKYIERYYLTEKNPGRIIINNTTINDVTFIQMDIPLGNLLTSTLKKEYQSIHSFNPPQWFNDLDNTAKAWLLSLVPKADEDGSWDSFEKLNFTSAMQNLPGLKNIRINYLLKLNKETKLAEMYSRGLRMATLVPIEIKDKKERERIADLNAEQFLDVLFLMSKAEFKQHWGFDAEELGIKPLIFIHSLLSNVDIKVLKKNIPLADTNMVEMQNRAIQSQLEQHANDKYKDGIVIIANDATNLLREAINITERIKGHDNSAYVTNIIDYGKTLLEKLPVKKLDSQRQRYVEIIKLAIDALEQLVTTEAIAGRNKASMKSALVKLLVYYLGAIHSTNCKSGKDRTQFDELALHSLHIFLDLYGKIAKYDDSESERIKYIDIYAVLFNTMKTFEAAAVNTVGAFGLKDFQVLCRDIMEEIDLMYKNSMKRADMNKPFDNPVQRAKDVITVLPQSTIEFGNQLAESERVYDDDIIKGYQKIIKKYPRLFYTHPTYLEFMQALIQYRGMLEVKHHRAVSLEAKQDTVKLIYDMLLLFPKPAPRKNNRFFSSSEEHPKVYQTFYSNVEKTYNELQKEIRQNRRKNIQPINLSKSPFNF